MSNQRVIQALTLLMAIGLFLTAPPYAQAGPAANYMTMGGFSPPSPNNSNSNYGGMYAYMSSAGMMGASYADNSSWMNNANNWQMMSNGTYTAKFMTDAAQWQAATSGQFGPWMDKNGNGIVDMIESANTWMSLTNGKYGAWMDKNGDDVYDGFQYITLPAGY